MVSYSTFSLEENAALTTSFLSSLRLQGQGESILAFFLLASFESDHSGFFLTLLQLEFDGTGCTGCCVSSRLSAFSLRSSLYRESSVPNVPSFDRRQLTSLSSSRLPVRPTRLYS